MGVEDLRIDVVGDPDGYQVTLRAPDGGEVTGALSRATVERLSRQLAELEHAVLLSTAVLRSPGSSESRIAADFGTALFDAIVPSRGRALLQRTREQVRQRDTHLRIVLGIRPHELARLPWEFLYDAEEAGYLALEAPLVRRAERPSAPLPLQARGPLRVLGMVARPSDRTALAVEDEQHRLSDALQQLRRTGTVELGWVEGQTWRALQDALRQGPWHAFHFIGHGTFDADQGTGALELASETGGTLRLQADELATLLRTHLSLRLVVLNACDTGRSGTHEPFSSVAGALLRRDIPAVVAMQFEISDPAAIEFSRTFYTAVAGSAPIDLAVTEARVAMHLDRRGTLEWGTPVLHLQARDATLFAEVSSKPGAWSLAPGSEQQRAEADESDTSRSDTAAAGHPGRSELDDRYTDGLDALYTERWEMAVDVFEQLVALAPRYRDAAAKLEQARRSHRLARLEAGARAAVAAGAWSDAVERYEALVIADPEHAQAVEELARARHEHALADLEQQVRWLHAAGRWQAVAAVGDQLEAIDVSRSDPDGLVSEARQRLADDDRQREVASRYRIALDELEAGALRPAHAALLAVQALDPSYRETTALIARVEHDLHARQDLLVRLHGAMRQLDGATRSRLHRALRHREAALRTAPSTLPVSPAPVSPPPLPHDHEYRDLLPASSWPLPRRSLPMLFAFSHHYSLTIDPAGSSVVTTGHGNEALRWSLDDGTPVASFGHDRTVTASAFDRRGELLVTSSRDGTAAVWDARDGRRRLTLPHGRPVQDVAIDPEARLVATVGGSQTAAVLWDATTGARVRELPAVSAEALRVAFSPDGRSIATARRADVTIFDAGTGNAVRTLPASNAHGLAFSAGGRLLEAGGTDGVVTVWDLTAAEPLHRLTHRGEVRCLAISPDGRWVAAAGLSSGATFSSGEVSLWDLRSPERRYVMRRDSWVLDVEFLPNGRELVTIRNACVERWDLTEEEGSDDRHR